MVIGTETETVAIVIVIMTLSVGGIVMMRRMTDGIGVIEVLVVTGLDRRTHLSDLLIDTAVNETVTMIASADTTTADRATMTALVTAAGIVMIARRILAVIAAEIETTDVIGTETMIVPRAGLVSVNASETDLHDDHLANKPPQKTATAVLLERTTAANATSTINEMAHMVETELLHLAQRRTNPTPRS
jgi:hypothetical protein